MILAKSHLMGPTMETSRRAQPKLASTPRGTPRMEAKPDHMEITFRMPVEKSMELMQLIKQSEGKAGAPVLLRANPQGDLHIVLGNFDEGADGEARETSKEEHPQMPQSRASVRVGDLSIHPGRHEVIYKEKILPSLTYTEFGILQFLAKHEGWVFSREQIVEGVKGKDYPVTDRAVDVQVAGLRKKLGQAACHIQTVRGVGYRFKG